MTNHEPRKKPTGDEPAVPSTPEPDVESKQSTIRVAGAVQLMVLVPHLIGYTPRRAVTVVATVAKKGGTSSSAGHFFTCRADLPERPEDLGPALDALVGPLRQAVLSQEDTALVRWHVYCYDVEVDQAQEICRVLASTAIHVGAELCDLYAIRDGHYLALIDQGQEALPAQWQRVPHARDVPATADLVLQGRAPVASREEFVAIVHQRDERATRATELALIMRGNQKIADPTMALTALGQWAVNGSPLPGAGERAVLATLLQDKVYRDAVLAWWAPDLFALDEVCPPEVCEQVRGVLPQWPRPDPLGARRLFELASMLPVAMTPPLLTIGGFLAWLDGEGTLASAAVEAALHRDPGYRMATYLGAAIAAGISPPQWSRAGRKNLSGNGSQSFIGRRGRAA